MAGPGHSLASKRRSGRVGSRKKWPASNLPP